MFLDQLDELLTVSFRLACSNTRYILQFIQCHRIGSGHRFQRGILENNERRHFQTFGQLLAQILHHREQSRIDGTGCSTAYGNFFFLFVELVVFGYFERDRFLYKLFSFFRNLQQTVVFDVLSQISGNQCLTDNGIPCLFFLIRTGTENFQFIVLVRLYFGGLVADQHVDNIFCLEFFL